jgi:hypothetical protein
MNKRSKGGISGKALAEAARVLEARAKQAEAAYEGALQTIAALKARADALAAAGRRLVDAIERPNHNAVQDALNELRDTLGSHEAGAEVQGAEDQR